MGKQYLAFDPPVMSEALPCRRLCKTVLLLMFVVLGLGMLLGLMPCNQDGGRPDLAVQHPATTMYNSHLAIPARTNLRFPVGSAQSIGMVQQALTQPVIARQPTSAWWGMWRPFVLNRDAIPVARAEFIPLTGPAANIQNPGEYPDKEFMADVEKRFPEEGIASIFQARALLALGYTWLDVRTPFEYDEGHVTGAVNIPIISCSRPRFDSSVGDRVYGNQKPNPDFIAEVQKRFPKKDAKILVGCSDGRKRSIFGLEALEKAGYTHIVGVKGGYMRWLPIYDSKLRRRRDQEMRENFIHKGDTSGFHGVGAPDWETRGFNVEKMPTKDKNEWTMDPK